MSLDCKIYKLEKKQRELSQHIHVVRADDDNSEGDRTYYISHLENEIVDLKRRVAKLRAKRYRRFLTRWRG